MFCSKKYHNEKLLRIIHYQLLDAGLVLNKEDRKEEDFVNKIDLEYEHPNLNIQENSNDNEIKNEEFTNMTPRHLSKRKESDNFSLEVNGLYTKSTIAKMYKNRQSIYIQNFTGITASEQIKENLEENDLKKILTEKKIVKSNTFIESKDESPNSYNKQKTVNDQQKKI